MMRTFLITAAAAASALAFATPASAQYYPYPQQPQGYGYGYQHAGNPWSNQLQQMRYEMNHLARQGRMTRSELRDMERDIHSAHVTIQRASYRGINRRQARALDRRIHRLRNQLHRYADYDRRYRRGW